MVAHFTMCTYDEMYVFSEKKNRFWLLFRCNQMPSANRNSWFTPYVHIVKWATILYKYHAWYLLTYMICIVHIEYDILWGNLSIISWVGILVKFFGLEKLQKTFSRVSVFDLLLIYFKFPPFFSFSIPRFKKKIF